MKPMKRRHFFKALAAGLLAPSCLNLTKEKNKGLNGSLFTIGENFTKSSSQSLVTKIDLQSEKIIQKVIPIPWGHLVGKFKPDELLVAGYHAQSLLVLNQSTLEVKRTLNLPVSHLCSGHFKIHNDKVYVGLYSNNYYQKDSKAALLVYDLKTEEQLKLLEFSTHGCHDIEIADDNHLVVSLTPAKKKKGYAYPESSGGVAIINSQTDSVVTEVTIKGNGAPEHIGVFDKENIFLGLTQYIPFKHKESFEHFLEKSDIEQSKLNVTSLRQKKVALDSPIKAFSLSVGTDINDFYFLKGEQKKLLSFAVDHGQEVIYVTCGHSNKLISFSPKTRTLINSFDGEQLGLKSLQGITVLGKDLVAVSGDHQDIVVFNPKEKSIMKKFKVTLHSSTHLSLIS